jgi:hypothetical protein
MWGIATNGVGSLVLGLEDSSRAGGTLFALCALWDIESRRRLSGVNVSLRERER